MKGGVTGAVLLPWQGEKEPFCLGIYAVSGHNPAQFISLRHPGGVTLRYSLPGKAPGQEPHGCRQSRGGGPGGVARRASEATRTSFLLSRLVSRRVRAHMCMLWSRASSGIAASASPQPWPSVRGLNSSPGVEPHRVVSVPNARARP